MIDGAERPVFDKEGPIGAFRVEVRPRGLNVALQSVAVSQFFLRPVCLEPFGDLTITLEAGNQIVSVEIRGDLNERCRSDDVKETPVVAYQVVGELVVRDVLDRPGDTTRVAGIPHSHANLAFR